MFCSLFRHLILIDTNFKGSLTLKSFVFLVFIDTSIFALFDHGLIEFPVISLIWQSSAYFSKTISDTLIFFAHLNEAHHVFFFYYPVLDFFRS